MIAITRARGAALAVPFLCLMQSGAFAAPPTEAFGNLPAISHVHLSPDGTHFSAIEPVGGRGAVLVFQLHPAPGAKPQVYSLPESTAVDSRWVNDDRVVGIYYQNHVRSESSGMRIRRFSRSVSMSISGKPPFLLMSGTSIDGHNGSTAAILGTDADNPNRLYLEAYLGDQLGYLGVDVETNKIDSTVTGNDATGDWILDRHGKPLARLDQTGAPDNKDTFYVKDGDKWREAASYDNYAGPVAEMQGLMPDGKAVAVTRFGGDRRRILETLPLAADAKPVVLFGDPAYDVEDVLHDEWTGAVIGVSYITDKVEHRYFDPQLDRIQKGLEKALPGQTVEISSWDAKRSLFLITAEDPRNPPGIYLYTAASGKLEYLMGAYPSLQADDLGEMKPYPYKARDGLDIHSYLTLPPGKVAKSLPMVVIPHGGPDDRDYLRFDWMAQFFASRGYAVLQPNFRGSTGYGQDFRDAGFHQWGRKMQDDISDGVKKTIADGIADPKRICIVGASYGGYAALAGASFTPELYACVVSYAGIADVSQILGDAARDAGANSSALHFWEARIGDRFADARALQAVSPALHADAVRAPVLLLHSTLDVTVPYTHSVREEAALHALGKPVQYVQLAGDDHYLQHADARIRLLQEMETFLAAHIGN
jgi:dipeptidyl aminopeptidase/acylaminoacyl peptidase